MRLMQPEQFCLTRLCRYMYCKLENFFAYGARDEINPRAKKSEFCFGVFFLTLGVLRRPAVMVGVATEVQSRAAHVTLLCHSQYN